MEDKGSTEPNPEDACASNINTVKSGLLKEEPVGGPMPKKHASDNLSARECLALVTLELVLLTIHYCMGAVGHAGVRAKKGREMKN